jgi:hypothetical protein
MISGTGPRAAVLNGFSAATTLGSRFTIPVRVAAMTRYTRIESIKIRVLNRALRSSSQEQK